MLLLIRHGCQKRINSNFVCSNTAIPFFLTLQFSQCCTIILGYNSSENPRYNLTRYKLELEITSCSIKETPTKSHKGAAHLKAALATNNATHLLQYRIL